MLKELEIGQTYHIKDCETLKREIPLYRKTHTKSLDEKIKCIASIKVTITKVYRYSKTMKYGDAIPGYSIKESSYLVYPHEVEEFDEKSSLNIF